MKHGLKILPKWFEDVKHQKKNFEIRRADRDFKIGDTLVLKEYENGRYTGREIERTIQYIYKGDGTYGLSDEFWILGLKTKAKIETIDELEKIKAKIEKLNPTDYGSLFSYEAHTGAGDMQDDIIDIIKNQTSELEGEKE